MDTSVQPQQPSQNLKSKRKQVAAACEACQRGKAKCDGDRPSCRRCIKRDTICEYDVEVGTSRSLSLRRKHETLQGEVNKLRELLGRIDHTPEVEVLDGRHRPESRELLGQAIEVGNGDTSAQQSVAQSRSNELSSALEDLDFSAISASNLRLHARPWTVIAGDGLVSELLSSFFAYDNCFYLPFVDQECFLRDMQAGDIIKADFCSPLLVNAICALRCPNSSSAKVFGSLQGLDVQQLFLAEARRLLEIECGRRSLATVQGLLIIYTCYVGQGKDRGAMQYRWMAYDMLARLQAELERTFTDLERSNEGATTNTAKAISRALWGVYCFESLTAFNYLEQSQVQAPRIPRRFLDGVVDPSMTGHSPDAESLQLSAYVLNLACDLSGWLYEIMEESGDIDIQKRAQAYHNLRQWSGESLSLIRADIKFRPEMYGLSMYEDMVALALILPLKPALRLANSLGTPESLCLQHCTRILETAESYCEVRSADRRSLSDIYPLFHAASMVLAYSPSTQRALYIFDRATSLLSRDMDDYALVRYLIQALNSVAIRLELPLSDNMAELVRRVKSSIARLSDVPVALVLPVPSQIVEDMRRQRVCGVRRMGIEVGQLTSGYQDLEIGSRLG